MKKIFVVVLVVFGVYGAMKAYQSHSTALAVSSYTGPWKDGTYTGQPVDNQYGTVQVAAVVSGGKITDVQFLQLPSDRAHSQEVSSFAKPQLLSETIQAQNANVDSVSGASQTSGSYIQSLQSALDQAK